MKELAEIILSIFAYKNISCLSFDLFLKVRTHGATFLQS